MEEIKKIIAFLSLDGETGLIDDANLLNQYRMLGTAKELRESKEKQRAKKPLANKYYYFCSNCGTRRSIKQKHKFCHDCGQAIDWSEEE